MYTAIVLDDLSKSTLISRFGTIIPMDWEIICHHMTVNLGNAQQGPASEFLGKKVTLKATKLAQNDRVIAVAVETDVPSNNPVKHITIAVNRLNGGKPKDSNRLTDWVAIKPIDLSGVVSEVSN